MLVFYGVSRYRALVREVQDILFTIKIILKFNIMFYDADKLLTIDLFAVFSK